MACQKNKLQLAGRIFLVSFIVFLIIAGSWSGVGAAVLAKDLYIHRLEFWPLVSHILPNSIRKPLLLGFLSLHPAGIFFCYFNFSRTNHAFLTAKI